MITEEVAGIEKPEWKNAPKLSQLKADYTQAKPITDKHRANIAHWLNVRNITGSIARPASKTRSTITPKMVRKQNEWRYASMTEPFLSTDDLITAKPVTFEDVEAARQAELLLNNQFNTKMSRVAFFDEYIRTLVDEGTALLRTSWYTKTAEVVEQVPITDPEVAFAYVSQGMEPIEEQVVTKTVANHPVVEIVPYNTFTIDPTCKGKIQNAKFIVVSFETSLSELKSSGIGYQNLDALEDYVTNTDINTYDEQIVDTGSFEFDDQPRKRLIAYEYWGYWDIHDTGIVEPIVCTWVNGVMIRLEENPFPDKELPFILVQYMPVRNECYGEPDAELLEDNQAINGAVMRGAIDIMARSSNGQMGSKRGALDPINKRRKDRGEDFEFNADANPNDVFYMQKFQEIPNSAVTMLQLQNNDAESLTGIKAFSSGISGKSLGEQGAGIKSALDATSKREVAIQRRLAAGVIEVARKFLAMDAVWLSEEEVIRISNSQFIPIKRDDLSGKIDITLSISTPEADNEKAQELAFMLQTTAQGQDPQETRMIRAEIARLRNMPALAKRIEEFQPPPPTPEQIQMQQLEMRKLEAEVKKLEAEAEEALAKAQELTAKVSTEIARAKDYTNKADMNNLAYLEREAGVEHERKLAEIKAKQTK